jgi:hypothetical protein
MSGTKSTRALLGSSAIISPTVAASWLPLSDSDARRWLRENSLIRDLDGRAVVVWGEVVACVSKCDPAAPRIPTHPLPRVSLRPL